MVVLVALMGMLVGWLLNVASAYLPRFAAVPPQLNSLPCPVILGFLGQRAASQPWFRLHLAVEWLTAAGFAWLGTRTAPADETLFLLMGFSFFMLTAVIDFKFRLVLNVVVYPAIAAALVVHITVLHSDLRGVLIGGALAFGVFYLVARLKPGELGGGDVKLAALIGLAFGFPHMLLVLLVGAGVGAGAAIILLARGSRRQHRIPYAPFLCLGAILILLYHSI